MQHLKNKLAILLGIIQGECAYTGPPYAVLDIIRHCNIRCSGCFFHCPQGRRPMPGNPAVDRASFALVDKICDELPRLGTREIFLVGEGEPFLHPQLIDFIGSFKRAGLKVQVYTNGTLFTEPLAQALVHSGLDILNISFWAVDEQEHKSCHPQTSPGLLQSRRAGAELIRKDKEEAGLKSPSVNFAFPINKHNCHNLKGRLQLIESLRPDSVSFGFFRDRGGQLQHLMLSPQEVQALSNELRLMNTHLNALGIAINTGDYLNAARLSPEAWHNIPCYAGWFQTYIKVDGTILPCAHCYHDVGNMMEQPFPDIWNGPNMKDFRRRGVRLKNAGPLPASCDCANCCQIKDNLRIHRLLKWGLPVLRRGCR